MTFQSRSHLIKHATSHGRKSTTTTTTTIQMPADNKINNFLESFSASLGDDMPFGIDEHFDTTSGGKPADDNSVRLSVDTIPEFSEAAAAEAAFALNQLPVELLRPTSEQQQATVMTSGGMIIPSSVQQDQSLQCDICFTKLRDKRAYIVHMKKHAGTQSLKCEFCGLILSGQQNFNKHIRTNHNMDPNKVQAIVVEEEFEPTAATAATAASADNEDNGSVLSSSESCFRGQSGRGSVASHSSNFDQQLATITTASLGQVSDSFVKCALCPEVFSSNELLQKHTATHFDAREKDDILREKLLMQTMRKKKKKKKRNPTTLPATAVLPLPVMPPQSAVSGLPLLPPSMTTTIKPKYRKTYSCLLCNSTFIKKASWGIHKIRHNGKGWKCQFCSNDLLQNKNTATHVEELHETCDHLKDHLLKNHNMSYEEQDLLGILKDANMFVVTKKLKPAKVPAEKSKPSASDSSSADSDSDSDDLEDEDEEDIDYEDEEEEEDDTTTNASTPTPFSVTSLPMTNPSLAMTAAAATTVTSAAAAPATVAAALASLVPTEPPVSTKSQPLHAPSPTPSSSSGSGLPVLKFIEDESLFDLDALTCHACNKSFKNTRAFKLHRDRHQGALKHKCPECIKTFNGRSEVNRHMVAIHGRNLNPGEDTLHKKGDQATKPTKLIDSSASISDQSVRKPFYFQKL